MVRVAVVGASGYMGGELLRLLVRHPGVDEITPVSRTYAGKPVSSIHRNLYNVLDEQFRDIPAQDLDSDIIFFAAPPAGWFEHVSDIIGSGIRVISLGGKFRIKDDELDHAVYGGHRDSALLAERVYGLPELYREDIRSARFIANPGCYSTSILLGLLPLTKIKEKLDLERLVVTSVSGTSGAGAKPSTFIHHPEAVDGVKPYNLFGHRHQPEINFILKDAFEKEAINLLFTPSVGNMARGIMSYLTAFSEDVQEDLAGIYSDFYKDEPFIRVVSGSGDNIPGIAHVVGTNYCDIGVNLDSASGRLLVLSTLDNLIKGGSGQAVQNMNIMFGFDEADGLGLVGGHP